MRALVIRRALGAARDVRAVGALLDEARAARGDALAAWLSSDEHGVTLVAEREGRAVGLVTVRLVRAPGGGPVTAAIVDALYVVADARRQGVGRALLDAARAEAEAREAPRFAVMTDAPGEAERAFLRAAGFRASTSWTLATPDDRVTAVPEAPSAPGEDFELAPGVTVRFSPGAPSPDAVTRWSGALAIRTRWRADLTSVGWSAEGCVGTPDDDEGDAARFDARTRALREAYLSRPRALRIDDALLHRVAEVADEAGSLALAPGADAFSLAPADVALFDLSLSALVALRSDAAETLAAGRGALRALGASPHVSLLFVDGRYAGWRARDPVSLARPMGWPETREARALTGDERAALTSLLYDWMVIDASPRADPSEAADPEEIAHMVSLRERARSLAGSECDVSDERDPTAGVARDVAAHIHWGWGFFKVGE